MQWVGEWQLCETKAQGWGGKSFVLGDGSRNVLFSRF